LKNGGQGGGAHRRGYDSGGGAYSGAEMVVRRPRRTLGLHGVGPGLPFDACGGGNWIGDLGPWWLKKLNGDNVGGLIGGGSRRRV
jgi:hypothetical protein